MNNIKRKIKPSQKDIVSLANLSINTTNKLIYLFFTILTFLAIVLGILGYKTIRDIKEDITKRIEEPVKVIESSKKLSLSISDSLTNILNQAKLIQSNVENYSILVKSSLYKSNEIYDSLSFRFKQSNEMEKTLNDYKKQLIQIKDDLNNQNKQIVDMSRIFATVGTENQNYFTGRERLLIYLLAYTADGINKPERQDPTIAFNVARMWYLSGEYKKALEIFETIKDKKTELPSFGIRIFDSLYNVCKEKIK